MTPSPSRPPVWRLGALVIVLVAVTWGGCTLFARRQPPPLPELKAQIRQRFPDVPQMSTDELARRLAQTPPPLVIDVREEAEFAVSHLPGAHRVPLGSDFVARVADLKGDAETVVLYCSVGYRSSDGAQRLIRAGWSEVYNLEGSAFQWANENRPLEGPNGPTPRVHPYDRKWGQLLDPEHRAEL